jgi:hypothetical protein
MERNAKKIQKKLSVGFELNVWREKPLKSKKKLSSVGLEQFLLIDSHFT